jgi:hypothetical protein
LPVEVKELPEDLAALDVLLGDRELLWPLVERWRREFEQTGRAVLTEGRPTIALETYVRLMVLMHVQGILTVTPDGKAPSQHPHLFRGK